MANTWQVEPLLAGEVTYPEGHPRFGETGPVFAFLLRRDEETLLVDTGVGPPHPWIDAAYRPVRHDLAGMLSRELEAAPLQGVILTHLHFDHVGMAHVFPGVPLYTQRAEWEAAHQPKYTIPEWVDFPGANYVLLDGDSGVSDGVSVLSTPGHTPGHQAVRVETKDGVVMIAGQAVETTRDMERFADGDASAAPSAESAARLLAERPSLMLFSHDRAGWRPAR